MSTDDPRYQPNYTGDDTVTIDEQLADIKKPKKKKPKRIKNRKRKYAPDDSRNGTTALPAEHVLDSAKVYRSIRKAALNKDAATVMAIISLRELYAGDSRIVEIMNLTLESAVLSNAMVDDMDRPDAMDEATFKVWQEQQKLWVKNFAEHIVGLMREGISTHAYRNMLDEADKQAGITLGAPTDPQEIAEDSAGTGEEE